MAKFAFIFQSLPGSSGRQSAIFLSRTCFQLRRRGILFAEKTLLEGNTHEQIIIYSQLFAGQLVGSWPMERKGKKHRMIKCMIHVDVSSETWRPKMRGIVLHIRLLRIWALYKSL